MHVTLSQTFVDLEPITERNWRSLNLSNHSFNNCRAGIKAKFLNKGKEEKQEVPEITETKFQKEP